MPAELDGLVGGLLTVSLAGRPSEMPAGRWNLNLVSGRAGIDRLNDMHAEVE